MKKMIQSFAYIDLLLGLVLASPVFSVWVVQFMHSTLSEEALLVDEYHAFLMKILGVMVILWAAVRIQHTEQWQVNYDCIARLVVLAFMAYYCYNGLTVLSFFIAIEVLGLYQWIVQKKANIRDDLT